MKINSIKKISILVAVLFVVSALVITGCSKNVNSSQDTVVKNYFIFSHNGDIKGFKSLFDPSFLSKNDVNDEAISKFEQALDDEFNQKEGDNWVNKINLKDTDKGVEVIIGDYSEVYKVNKIGGKYYLDNKYLQ